MSTKTRTQVFATVWRHWKPSFVTHRWAVFLTFLFYTLGASCELMLRPRQWKQVFDALVSHHNPWSAFYAIIGLSVGMWIAHRLGEFFIVNAEAKIIRQLKDYALHSLMGKSMEFFSAHASGGLVAKVKRFASVSETVMDESVFSISRSVFFVIYLVIFTAFTIPKLSIIFGIWIVVFVIITMYISRIRMRFDLESSEADSITTGHIADILISLMTLRVFARTKEEYESFTIATKEEQRRRLKAWFLGNIQRATQGFLMVILEIVCMYSIVKNVTMGTETIGTAVMIQAYIASLSSYMWGFGHGLVKIRIAFADAYEMSTLLDHSNTEPVQHQLTETILTKNSLEFENVSFGYSKESTALDTIHFSFREGVRYGIVGESGSGKTTLIKLLLRLYENDHGIIRIGDSDIKHINKHTLRSWIAYVPQQPLFPSRTVREIIMLGKNDASEDDVIIAAKKACCDFVFKLPRGLDTQVGERGIKLSGGECQRLAIAAAILKDAPIVIWTNLLVHLMQKQNE